MTGGLHLSMRVPWHDAGWRGTVCDDPAANASCIMLHNIGGKRDDEYEQAHAGESLDALNANSIPCIAERSTFLSPHGYLLEREHPYSFRGPLKGKIQRTPSPVPAYGVHATPYFWLSRDNTDEVMRIVDVDYQESREEFVNDTLGFTPKWVIHGDNQIALMSRFFQEVVPEHNLIFFYVKHSPFTAPSTSAGRNLLIGAARITDIALPVQWRTTGDTPFPNYMWETSVQHSLRPDGTGGIVLPVAQLSRIDADPDAVAGALAWAPQYGGREFAYVTEHVSDDTAIAALERLYEAALRSRELGLAVADASLDWVSDRIAELWTMRGPSPGLGAVLEILTVPHGPVAARQIARLTPADADPWLTLEALMDDPAAGGELAPKLAGTPRKAWRTLQDTERAALRLLARFNLTTAQTSAIFEGNTGVSLSHAELLTDPYYIYTCLLDGPDAVAFDVVDRGCFPEQSIRSAFPLAAPSTLDDPADARRVTALLVAILENAATNGHTLLPLPQALTLIEQWPLGVACPVSELVLRAHDLHPSDLPYDEESPYWPPLCGATLADGSAAFKLTWLETGARVIRAAVNAQLARPRQAAPSNFRALLDAQLKPVRGDSDADIRAEHQAREEKTAALVELFSSPLSVLNGRAGTGKTTLIRALADQEQVKQGGLVLLAPTGKARVQLTKKVGVKAQTLAQFLGKYGRYDRESGAYTVDSSLPKAPRAGTVVVDESSMLTEAQLAALLDALHPPDRLILVGDPRQLPPIGAGRPFVDLITRMVSETPVPPFPRVVPGYAELTVLRRQAGEIRDDLMLAAWFSGDEIPDGFEEVWHRLRGGVDTETLRAIPWGSARPEQAVDRVLADELGVTGANASALFEQSYGGKETGLHTTFPKGAGGAGAGCESWQILSPTRTYPWGTIELNRRLKRKHRSKALKDALKPKWNRNVPSPIGVEQIVLGDKVLNNMNTTRRGFPNTEQTMNYVANGEIGVVVGAIGKAPRWTNVEFSSQVGTTYGYSGSDEDNPALELAWAITVHKSQGSEFAKVFVLLPGSSRRLSRELLYTALTRQKTKVVLLHERPIDELFELTRSTGSETARRLTDLFIAPRPQQVRLPDGTDAGTVDTNLVHVAGNGVLVRSKNEVIIAGLLEAAAPGNWSYELPLTGTDGQHRLPDFTINTPDGRTIYWEHLGMLDTPAYAAGWKRKKQWYHDQGVLPFDEGGGPHGTLVWTDDRGGVDVPAW
ncbi:MAG: hypothetical protein QOH97_4054, partial [Actinoplanes sp.]|nr:hypothetical protein [Actinoplanes sp.]